MPGNNDMGYTCMINRVNACMLSCLHGIHICNALWKSVGIQVDSFAFALAIWSHVCDDMSHCTGAVNVMHYSWCCESIQV